MWGFLYELSLPPGALDRFLRIWGFVPARMWSGEYPLSASIATIFVAMFLHAGWLHVGGNMLFLWIFGDNVEDRLGHFRYLVFYLLCGLAASLCHAFFNPASRLPSLGASGAISGVLAAYLFLYPRARILTLVPIFLFFTAEVPAFLFIVFWFVVQFFSGTASLSASTPTTGGTAYFAHIGGFVAGIVFLALLKPPRRAPPSYSWS
ncbi:MAG TPA: rhomboid family intramembrane serine protease [Thermoanaerobaculia bacterium]|nr:rhomboid family intramembrane serine protease [Thermoanaerobaculia bacterium]